MLREESVTREILGAFFAVYNELDFGHLESVYANALALELSWRGLKAEREVPLTVCYRGHEVGFYRADLVIERAVLVELKATRDLDPQARRQTLNYIRATNLGVGLLLHFGAKPRFERVVGPRADPCPSVGPPPPQAASGSFRVPRCSSGRDGSSS